MAYRFVLVVVTSFYLTGFCAFGVAETPLVIAELDSQRAVASAEADLTRARADLAAWTCRQLQELKKSGHASWQEVAQQEIEVEQAAADAKAAQEFLKAIHDWKARIADDDLSSENEFEAVQLFMPGSTRLVAWIPTNVANKDLSNRHLENLRREYRSTSSLDLEPLKTAVNAARRAVKFYSSRDDDQHLLRRDEIRLRIAKAEYVSQKARKENAAILARRIALVRDSISAVSKEPERTTGALASLGTRFVDATSDHELSALVKTMAVDEGKSNEDIRLAQQHFDSVSERIASLKKLAGHAQADQDMLDQAKRQREEMIQQIRQAQLLIRVKQQIARQYELLDSQLAADVGHEHDSAIAACVVRHRLTLRKTELQAEANRAAIKAQRDYLMEREKRVERISETARPPKELDHMRFQIRAANQRLAAADREWVALRREQKRFTRQIRLQASGQYQLVQAAGGTFIGRDQFEMAQQLIATIGFVGHWKRVPDRPYRFPYIESTSLLDCMSELCTERPELTTGLADPKPCLRAGVFARRHWVSDRIECASDLFCDAPYGRWTTHWNDRWVPCRDRLLTSRLRYRPFSTCRDEGLYQRDGVGFVGHSIFSSRFDCVTHLGFPHRSRSYYGSAFPERSNLYTSPYARPSVSFSGLGYTAWLNASCFD